MGMWDWLFDWVSARSDAKPQLPALPGPAEIAERRDSTYNPLTFLGGPRDKGSVARPSPFVLQLSDRDLENAYTNSAISRRIVDLLPDEATRKGWTVPDVPATEDQRLNTYEAFADGGKMGRLYGGSVGLMVTEDDVPRSTRGTLAFQRNPAAYLADPLDLERVGELVAFHIFDPYEARPAEIERDVRQPGYRLPRIWSFGADGFSGRVHASRVIYFRGNKRPPSQAWGSWNRRSNLMPDDSVLQVLWDEIRRLIETGKGGAVLAQELSQNVLTIKELASKTTSDEAGAFKRIMARIQQSLGLLGMVVLAEGDKFERHATPATGFKDLSEGAQMMLSMALGWPRSMLSGEAPGGLSTDDESGLERERKIISTYQEQRLRRPLEQFYQVVYAAQDGPTNGQIPDEWALAFNPLSELSDKELADLRLVVAQTDHIYMTDGAYGPEVVAEQRFGAEGFELELRDVPIPDPDEEAAIAAARRELEGGARADAIDPDSVCILVPAADTGLRTAVERAIGQTLTTEGEPHVTLLYLGKGITEVDEVIQVASEEAGRALPGTLARGTVRALSPGDDGTPIVVEFDEAWAAQPLHDALLAGLAHLVRSKQFRRYRPHVTIGYASQPLSAEAMGALAGIDASAVRVPISAVAVTVGKTTRAVVAIGQDA